MKIAYLSLGLLSLLTPLTAAWSKEDREIFRIRDEISAHEPNPAATFYDILGVPPSASFDDINRAHRKKTMALHPDKVAQRLRAERVKKAGGKGKKSAIKPPSSAEVKAAVKQASERQTRLSLIASILKGPSRDRYDHFLAHGFPLWKGTDYYYNRYRPGLGTVMVGLFIVGGGAIHYLILYMSWKRQREFVGRYVKFARDTAWGGNLGIPNIEPRSSTPATASDEEAPPPVPQNRKERRMQEKEAKKEGGRGRAKKVTKKTPSASRDASSGPTGVRKRVVAENGKILVVDSLGDVYLEEQDEEGNVNEYLLDPNELLQPTFRDTAVVRLPMHIFNLTVGRFTGSRDAVSDSETVEAEEVIEVSQQTPTSESAGDDFELLDKSTDSLGKAKSSGMEKSGKSSKRKNKKR
ncbi:DnaJ domain or J-domain-containing protein [Metarhizium guizhouense ARSEF 977]|uniref:DnaJ domain or J-domain-containing protein n=1 Tax=Metarhizium guizhouense (strain ARSEF 977) TaxID=1276136 RepID=A0A0B4H778_METGA|nr:DnaJ domain or J-domain-containing protein [Metarhizium guizhouense ARSEF 977]